MTTRRYSELQEFVTFEDRFEYLKLRGTVGRETFGYDRYLNQQFYRSHEWRNIRKHVIARDGGFDLGVEGFEIHERLLIHHMNPVTEEEILHGISSIVDPEYLITVSHKTHNAIHYGTEAPRTIVPIERRPGDTKLW